MDLKEKISQAAERRKLSHAYIIAGREDDALDMALYIARAGNCMSETRKPCDQCIPCRKIKNSNHPDVSVIRTGGASVGIDVIRGLQEDIHVKPYEGIRKVYIIAEGEKMTVQAQNCLLKVLEDPPGAGTIIIISSNHHNLLPTIISRCQVIKLSARNRNMNPDLYEDFMGCLMEGDFVKTSSKIEQLSKETNQWAAEFLDLLLTELRDILVLKATGRNDLLCLREYDHITMRAASDISYDRLDKLINAVSGASEALRGNANVQLTMEVLSLEMQEVFI